MLMDALAGGLIVSCQAYPGEPMASPDTMSRVAQAAALGGAAGIRAQGIEDIRRIRDSVDLPLIGLCKDGDSGVVITAALEEALACARAGANLVALDATGRPRLDGLSVAETIHAIHQQTDALVMADISNYAEGMAAQDAHADLVATTLSGYTDTSGHGDGHGPDLDLVAHLADELTVPVIAEGRIHQPKHVAAAFARGAFAVVVGTAITHPTTLTRWFVRAAAQEYRDDTP